jgi:hypothetical protein
MEPAPVVVAGEVVKATPLGVARRSAESRKCHWKSLGVLQRDSSTTAAAGTLGMQVGWRGDTGITTRGRRGPHARVPAAAAARTTEEEPRPLAIVRPVARFTTRGVGANLSDMATAETIEEEAHEIGRNLARLLQRVQRRPPGNALPCAPPLLVSDQLPSLGIRAGVWLQGRLNDDRLKLPTGRAVHAERPPRSPMAGDIRSHLGLSDVAAVSHRPAVPSCFRGHPGATRDQSRRKTEGTGAANGLSLGAAVGVACGGLVSTAGRGPTRGRGEWIRRCGARGGQIRRRSEPGVADPAATMPEHPTGKTRARRARRRGSWLGRRWRRRRWGRRAWKGGGRGGAGGGGGGDLISPWSFSKIFCKKKQRQTWCISFFFRICC